jgi:hypothetical protein
MFVVTVNNWMDIFYSETMEIRREVVEWMRENIGYEAKSKYDLMTKKSKGTWCFELFGDPDLIFYFKIADHAVLFKLTWLGTS